MTHGLKLKKVHRAIRFERVVTWSPTLRWVPSLRTVAKNEFDKNSFRFMNNSLWENNGKDYEKWQHETSEKPRVTYQRLGETKL